MFKTLSGRLIVLTILFVMLVEVAVFVPSIARFRQDYLALRLERAQIASLALLADDMITAELEQELLANAGVYNVVLRRDARRQLVLSSPLPGMITRSFDMRAPTPWVLVRDAIAQLFNPQNEVIRVIGQPVRDGGDLIEVTMDREPLRAAMMDYGVRIFWVSAVISGLVATLIFLSVRALMVRPIRFVVDEMQRYAGDPEDMRRIITPTARIRELREAEEALLALQTQISSQLRHKDRLAQLGGAVAKISHDLRNILTSAQLFTDRIEASDDPVVQRLAPKLVGSITRAVSLCEATLAFGRAEETPPRLTRFALAPLIEDVLEGERLACAGQGIDLLASVPPALHIRADSEHLHRVLTNLVRNARQAIAASASTGQVNIRAFDAPTDWVISITDTGPGLSQRAQEALFTPFTSDRRGGSGLGLVIAQELLRGHGGEVRLVETGDQGTRFDLVFPK